MRRDLIFAPEARDDLAELYHYIADQAGALRANGYVERITAFCEKLALKFPERGTRRDDLEPGLRVIGFERRATIAFHVEDQAVIIARILYGGRDLAGAFGSRA